MWGESFTLLGLQLNTFRFFHFLAYAVGGVLFLRLSIKANVSAIRTVLMLLGACIAGPLGGIALADLEHGRGIAITGYNGSGTTHIGGYISALLMLTVIARALRAPVLQMLDSATVAWIGAFAIGKLGCFFSGDGCYGRTTDTMFGMSFPHGIVPTTSSVLPAPLFEMGNAVLIFCLALILRSKSSGLGTIFLGMGSAMFLAQFAVEFIRTNPSYAGLTLTQWFDGSLFLAYSITLVSLTSARKGLPAVALKA